jgi:MOSC domain-containing protein YiiM
MGKLVSIQIGVTQTYTDGQGTWETAFHKEPVMDPIYLGKIGLEGDSQANKKHHGGPDKAVLMYSADHYPKWEAELGKQFPKGGFSENLTVSGLDETIVCVGDVFQIGAVKLQVTQPRSPCRNISRFWKIPDLLKRVTHTGRTGWYCRVLTEGNIEAGTPVELIERPNPGETVLKISKS